MEKLELHSIIKDTAHETVKETLSSMGFDTKNPQEIQADLRYLNKTRKGSEFLAIRIKATIIASMVPTVLYLFWQAFKLAVKSS